MCPYNGWYISGIIACRINIHVHIEKYLMLIYREQTFHLKVSMTLVGRKIEQNTHSIYVLLVKMFGVGGLYICVSNPLFPLMWKMQFSTFLPGLIMLIITHRRKKKAETRGTIGSIINNS